MKEIFKWCQRKNLKKKLKYVNIMQKEKFVKKGNEK